MPLSTEKSESLLQIRVLVSPFCLILLGSPVCLSKQSAAEFEIAILLLCFQYFFVHLEDLGIFRTALHLRAFPELLCDAQ